MSLRRIFGVYRRFGYSFIHSPPSIYDLVFWPIVDLMMWGLLSTFFRSQEMELPLPIGFLLGGVLLWDLLFRANIGVSTAFLEDTSWSRNMINMLVTPLKPAEWVTGAALWSFTKVSVSWVGMAALAAVLFGFFIPDLGIALIIFLPAILIFGVAVSMVVVGICLRFGPGADILAWGLLAGLLPLSAVYYPVRILPTWAQSAAYALPTAHIFEAMRTILGGGAVPWDALVTALLLDGVYLAGALAFAFAMFGTLRRRGFITRYI